MLNYPNSLRAFLQGRNLNQVSKYSLVYQKLQVIFGAVGSVIVLFKVP